jgi:two-component system CheB/CheR fusion protein
MANSVNERITILVVEDNTEVRQLSVTTLEHLGYDVLDAPDATTALGILDTKHEIIDLLFSDVMMSGGIDGFELAEQTSRRFPHIKILMTSGGQINLAAAPAGIGNAAFPIVRKPFHLPELSAALTKVLKHERD